MTIINIKHIQSKWSSIARYALAFVFFAIALSIRLLIAPAEAGLPFLVFYPAMVITFYLCGIGSGVFFTILSAISGYYLFTPPYWSFVPSYESVITVSTYSISATLIGLIISKMQRNLALLNQLTIEH
jgi:K+-sensing histidine kinase KdpD